jgi:hypothetical protein
MDVLRARGASARSSELESAASAGAARFAIEVARAGAEAGDDGRAGRKGDVEAGVPEVEAGPLKRETSGDLWESVCGVVGSESAEMAEVEEAARGVVEEVVAVAEMVDILGAALCEGTR